MTSPSFSNANQPASFAFTAENLDKAKKIIARYPEGRQASAVMPLLDLAQRQHDGWLPTAAMNYVADMIGVPMRIDGDLYGFGRDRCQQRFQSISAFAVIGFDDKERILTHDHGRVSVFLHGDKYVAGYIVGSRWRGRRRRRDLRHRRHRRENGEKYKGGQNAHVRSGSERTRP